MRLPRGRWLTPRRAAALAASLVLLVIVALSVPRVAGRVRMARERRVVRGRIAGRLKADVSIVRQWLDAMPLAVARRQELDARLRDAERAIASVPEPDLASFTTVLPLNPLHERILAVHGAALAAAGMPPLVVWKTHRYDAVPFIAGPPHAGEPRPRIDIVVMRNEVRADAFLLTNATGRPADVRLVVSDVPGSPRPEWLRVSAMEWTDTRDGEAVADALPDAAFAGGAFRLHIPAGMTRKVWLTVDGSGPAPGTYRGNLDVRTPDMSALIPFDLRVSDVTMGRPRLSLGTWDYTNGTGAYGITPKNRDAAIALMRSHFVDSPWATAAVLPWPSAADYDARGQLAHALDFRALDDWIHLWPGARRYYVVAGVGDRFAGAAMNTAEFAARVGAWGRALGQHASSIGLTSRQLGLLLVDEPQRDEQNAIIAAWARALKAAAPDIDLFEDPVWPRPDQVSPSESLTLVDELCFHLGVYSRGGEPVARYFEERRAAGQRLWVYQTTGPARMLDPTAYYRLEAWYGFRANVVGIAFWAFGDTGGAETSWNEYATADRIAYAPAFIGRESVTGSVHLEAVREGIEDYEYLAMLRDAAARTADPALRARAVALLDEAIAEVAVPYTGNFDWRRDARHARPDAYRLRMLDLLETMQETGSR